MDFAPPIAISASISHLCVEVGALVGELAPRLPPQDQALSQSLHDARVASFLDEQGWEEPRLPHGRYPASLSPVVSALLEKLDTYDPTSLSDLMRVNTVLADTLGSWAIWRAPDDPGIAIGGIPPAAAENAPRLLEQLLDWYGRTELHPLVASCVFRMEYSLIQPFAKAAELSGRLWHALMLETWSPVFRWVCIESALHEMRSELCAALSDSRRRINDAPYVALVLEGLKEALETLKHRFSTVPPVRDRHERLLAYFRENPNATIETASKTLGFAQRTCARYVANLKRDNHLVRVGSRRNGHWLVP